MKQIDRQRYVVMIKYLRCVQALKIKTKQQWVLLRFLFGYCRFLTIAISNNCLKNETDEKKNEELLEVD